MLLFDRCLSHPNRGGVGGPRTLIHASHTFSDHCGKALFLFEDPVSHYIKASFDNKLFNTGDRRRSLLDRSIEQKPKSKKRRSRSPLGDTRQLNPRNNLDQSHLVYSFGIKNLKPGCGSAEYRARIELVVHQTTSLLFYQYTSSMPPLLKYSHVPVEIPRMPLSIPHVLFLSVSNELGRATNGGNGLKAQGNTMTSASKTARSLFS